MKEQQHHVRCYSDNREVYSCIYDPNGNAMTYAQICDLINELQDENYEMRGVLQNIIDCRNEFEGPSMDYMQGYRDGQQFLQALAKVGVPEL